MQYHRNHSIISIATFHVMPLYRVTCVHELFGIYELLICQLNEIHVFYLWRFYQLNELSKHLLILTKLYNISMYRRRQTKHHFGILDNFGERKQQMSLSFLHWSFCVMSPCTVTSSNSPADLNRMCNWINRFGSKSVMAVAFFVV